MMYHIQPTIKDLGISFLSLLVDEIHFEINCFSISLAFITDGGSLGSAALRSR